MTNGRMAFRLPAALWLLAIALLSAPLVPGSEAQGGLDVVIRRVSRYVDFYLKDLGGIIGEESLVRKTQVGSPGHDVKRERRLVSDFRTTPVGDDWLGMRRVREIDGVRIDPMFQGRLGEPFDLLTPAGRAQRIKAITFENSRFFVGDSTAGINIPTFPLEFFREPNLGLFEFRMRGDDQVDGRPVWKIEVRDRTARLLSSYPLTGTVWVEPGSGRVLKAEIVPIWSSEPVAPRTSALPFKLEVRYAWNPGIEMWVPAQMDYQEASPGYRSEMHATYRNFARYSAQTRLDVPGNHSVAAQSPDLLRQDDAYSLRVNVRLVTLEASVTGNAGPVLDLKTDDFVVTENGIPQTITHFRPVSTPFDVLLLFDRSTSTGHETSLMQQAAKSLIGGLRPEDRVGLATYGYAMQVWTRWTDTRRQVLNTLSKFPVASGGTRFYYALVQSLIGELVPVAGRRRVLVVLTDGRDNRIQIAVQRYGAVPLPEADEFFNQTLEVVRKEHVPIYIAALNTDRNLTVGAFRNDEYLVLPNHLRDSYLKSVRSGMEKLAYSSGGRILFPVKLDDVIPLYKQLGEEIGTAYSLGYVSNATEDDRRFREIKVTTRRPGLHVVQSRVGYGLP
jgi:VWFA-related protein